MLLWWLCTCRTAAGFLQEGSLDTRTYGKRLLWAVKAVLRGSRPDMDRLVSGMWPLTWQSMAFRNADRGWASFQIGDTCVLRQAPTVPLMPYC